MRYVQEMIRRINYFLMMQRKSPLIAIKSDIFPLEVNAKIWGFKRHKMQNADDHVVFSTSMVSLQKLMAIVLIFFILSFLSIEAYWVMQTSLNSVEFIILFFTFYTFSN